MIKKKRLLGVIAAGLFVLANIITGCQNAENTTSKKLIKHGFLEQHE